MVSRGERVTRPDSADAAGLAAAAENADTDAVAVITADDADAVTALVQAAAAADADAVAAITAMDAPNPDGRRDRGAAGCGEPRMTDDDRAR